MSLWRYFKPTSSTELPDPRGSLSQVPARAIEATNNVGHTIVFLLNKGLKLASMHVKMGLLSLQSTFPSS